MQQLCTGAISSLLHGEGELKASLCQQCWCGRRQVLSSGRLHGSAILMHVALLGVWPGSVGPVDGQGRAGLCRAGGQSCYGTTGIGTDSLCTGQEALSVTPVVNSASPSPLHLGVMPPRSHSAGSLSFPIWSTFS